MEVRLSYLDLQVLQDLALRSRLVGAGCWGRCTWWGLPKGGRGAGGGQGGYSAAGVRAAADMEAG